PFVVVLVLEIVVVHHTTCRRKVSTAASRRQQAFVVGHVGHLQRTLRGDDDQLYELDRFVIALFAKVAVQRQHLILLECVIDRRALLHHVWILTRSEPV